MMSLMALTPEEAARSVCRLETMGRNSGEPREIEIWFAATPDGTRLYLLAGGRERAHWVRNAVANPAVRVRVAGRWIAGRAGVVEGTPDEPAARQLLAAKYQSWREGRPMSEWARTSLPLRVDLSD
jgi:deazaflavin-dependent oxidoreductase (nitroreductase family)